MHLIKNTLLASIAGCAFASSAFGTIVASNNITVTATDAHPVRPITTVIDYTTLDTPNDETASYSANVIGEVFHTASTSPSTVTFDFTTAETIDTVFLWNYGVFRFGDFSNRGVQSFTVELFDSSDASISTHNFTATQETITSTPVIAAQSFSLGSAVADVSSATFTLNSNYGGDFIGFSHAAFGTAATIPEPSHFALGFAGIAMLAICLRRRTKKNA